MFKRLFAAALVLGMVGQAPPASAMPKCALRADIIDVLQDTYDEVKTAGGLQSETQLMEIWTAPDTGRWTVLMTSPNGVSCVMASGDNWVHHAPAQPDVAG